MINGSPGDTFEISICIGCKDEKKENIKYIYRLHSMQLRCIKCAFFAHNTYGIITSFKLVVLQINIEQCRDTNLTYRYATIYLEKYGTCTWY